MERRPAIALTVGDPAGVGPELCLRLLDDVEVRERMRLVVVGPEELRPAHVPAVAMDELPACAPAGDPASDPVADPGAGSCVPPGVLWVATGTRGAWTPGRATAAGGHAALAALRAGYELASRGAALALVTAPVSKRSLHLAGEPVEGQTELFERWSAAPLLMLGVADRLRVAPLTRHLPLRRALDRVTPDAVLDGLRRLAAGLAALGLERPRLALAGWNPHAGEGGLLGSEDDEVLVPAVARAREEGLDVEGPLPADGLFPRAAGGAFDAVLALFHDQAFVPVKLHAPDRAVTVLLGLPFPRVSPAHGTAFDLAGTGRADPSPLRSALLHAARWAVRPVWWPWSRSTNRA